MAIAVDHADDMTTSRRSVYQLFLYVHGHLCWSSGRRCGLRPATRPSRHSFAASIGAAAPGASHRVHRHACLPAMALLLFVAGTVMTLQAWSFGADLDCSICRPLGALGGGRRRSTGTPRQAGCELFEVEGPTSQAGRELLGRLFASRLELIGFAHHRAWRPAGGLNPSGSHHVPSRGRTSVCGRSSSRRTASASTA